jgi:crotonobetainyl-CoA:carnitine CoA-transferase CaiB-like acyl-CoA transferase
MDAVLSGVRVIDLTWHIAGPFCTKLLADYGADVIKVERPGSGDPSRGYGPFPGDRPDPEQSGHFLHLNTNKRGITLDLKRAAGREILRALVRDANLLVESFSPRVMPSLGLGYAELAAINPRLVYVSISNFGQTGPYRDYRSSDLITYAMGGPMFPTGVIGREPVKLGPRLMEYQAGHMAAAATLGALFGAEASGAGQQVDVSIMETQLGGVDRRIVNLLGYQYTGEVAGRDELILGVLPLGSYPCKDGYVFLTIFPNFWKGFTEMVGQPELQSDPRFTEPGALFNPERRADIDLIIYPWLGERTRAEVQAAAQAAHVPGTAIQTAADLLEDPHLEARAFWTQIAHPVAGALPHTGAPFRLGEGQLEVAAWRPAPLLGQHNAAILGGELGMSAAELALLRAWNVI